MAKVAPSPSLQAAKNTIQAAIDGLHEQSNATRAELKKRQAELTELCNASLSFDDYASYVRMHMRRAAQEILRGFNESVLSSSGARTPRNLAPWAIIEDGDLPHVWPDGGYPDSMDRVNTWEMLCFLGGEKFEDLVIEKLRGTYEAVWDRRRLPSNPVSMREVESEEEARHLEAMHAQTLQVLTMPVEQRRVRRAELQGVIDELQSTLNGLDAELNSLTAVVNPKVLKDSLKLVGAEVANGD